MTYFKSSIKQYSTMPEYIAVREQQYDMSRVDIALSILIEHTSMLCRELVCM